MFICRMKARTLLDNCFLFSKLNDVFTLFLLILLLSILITNRMPQASEQASVNDVVKAWKKMRRVCWKQLSMNYLQHWNSLLGWFSPLPPFPSYFIVIILSGLQEGDFEANESRDGDELHSWKVSFFGDIGGLETEAEVRINLCGLLSSWTTDPSVHLHEAHFLIGLCSSLDL